MSNTLSIDVISTLFIYEMVDDESQFQKLIASTYETTNTQLFRDIIEKVKEIQEKEMFKKEQINQLTIYLQNVLQQKAKR